MFWKKKREVPKTIDIEEHLREFLYDSQLVQAEELALILGATPVSEEGREHHRHLSDSRIEKISYLIPLVHSYAHIVSDAMISLEKKEEEEEPDFPDEFWTMMRTLIEQISISVTLGVLSQVTELGLIKVRDK
jgi:hypothetical protein